MAIVRHALTASWLFVLASAAACASGSEAESEAEGTPTSTGTGAGGAPSSNGSSTSTNSSTSGSGGSGGASQSSTSASGGAGGAGGGGAGGGAGAGGGGGGGAGGSSTSSQSSSTSSQSSSTSSGCVDASACLPASEPCMVASCEGGMCGFQPQIAGTSCSVGGKVCTGAGACVECLSDADCDAPDVCISSQCKVKPLCTTSHLVISEIRSRGAGGDTDEFIELYNPTSASISLANHKIFAKFTDGGSGYDLWIAPNATLPAGKHYLIGGAKYSNAVTKDSSLPAGLSILDAASLVLKNGSATVDAVCYGYNATTKSKLQGAGFTCEGAPVDNPHDETAATNTSASIERRPGGALGNCTDTDGSAEDFMSITTANPQNLASAPTP